jgi:pimeloyl-ACP methyl ester carboxylesterase
LNLQCSHWEPVERTVERIPVVIYMHGNASARVEVLPQLTVLLALGVAVFAFDFAGSGKSDGEHVTLGYFEREDLLCVVAHLRATDVVSTIALWGRSMGAGGSFCRDGTIFRRGSTWCRQSKASSSNLLLDHIFHLTSLPPLKLPP